ncbi:hypothetical protein AB0D67_33945 [Streptosporangium sp. NPDC048047]|uniref:hypothetical protein n=1 Tax=Streptosporangium sp. NPDC048047 TaxID=3155748 RepID=UPI0034341C9C
MTRYRADERRGLHGLPEPPHASATPADAMRLLRQALHGHGVATPDGDVMRTSGGHYTLSLAPGLLVWSVPDAFRWFDGGGMVRHPSTDPEGAAGLLAKLFGRNSSLRRQREYLDTLTKPAGAAPV